MAICIALYGVNALIFRGLGIPQHSPESKVCFVHLVYGAIASGLYKAFSVPRPFKSEEPRPS